MVSIFFFQEGSHSFYFDHIKCAAVHPPLEDRGLTPIRFLQIHFRTLMTPQNLRELNEILPDSLSDNDFFVDFHFNRVNIDLTLYYMTLG